MSHKVHIRAVVLAVLIALFVPIYEKILIHGFLFLFQFAQISVGEFTALRLVLAEGTLVQRIILAWVTISFWLLCAVPMGAVSWGATKSARLGLLTVAISFVVLWACWNIEGQHKILLPTQDYYDKKGDRVLFPEI